MTLKNGVNNVCVKNLPTLYCGGNFRTRKETFDCDGCHRWQHCT